MKLRLKKFKTAVVFLFNRKRVFYETIILFSLIFSGYSFGYSPFRPILGSSPSYVPGSYTPGRPPLRSPLDLEYTSDWGYSLNELPFKKKEQENQWLTCFQNSEEDSCIEINLDNIVLISYYRDGREEAVVQFSGSDGGKLFCYRELLKPGRHC